MKGRGELEETKRAKQKYESIKGLRIINKISIIPIKP